MPPEIKAEVPVVAIQKPHMRAGDVFLHLGAFVSLYVCIGAILSLLYTVINAAFPSVTPSIYSYFVPSSISFEVATLIVFFPIFLALSWINQKRYVELPAIKETTTRRALVFFTLFVSGLSMAGDLVTVIYSFLNGDDFTASFVLKSLSILVVFGGVFVYYILDVRNKLTTQSRNLLRILAIILILASVVWGFSVLGSPRTQRGQKVDQQKVTDLESIQTQIISSYQQKGTLPQTIASLNNSLSYITIPRDPTTNADYEYRVSGPLSFELCSTFSSDASKQTVNMYGYGGGTNSNWQYTKGHYCFERSIDPLVYPVYNTGTTTITSPIRY